MGWLKVSPSLHSTRYSDAALSKASFSRKDSDDLEYSDLRGFLF
jgi:hypothetical protein